MLQEYRVYCLKGLLPNSHLQWGEVPGPFRQLRLPLVVVVSLDQFRYEVLLVGQELLEGGDEALVLASDELAVNQAEALLLIP